MVRALVRVSTLAITAVANRAAIDPAHTLRTARSGSLEDTLAASKARWKFVIAHHQFGGGLIDIGGGSMVSGRGIAYGRGSANEALRQGTDQAVVHELMRRHGAQFFVYGHDHAFCHSVQGPVDYLLCGRPTCESVWVPSGLISLWNA